MKLSEYAHGRDNNFNLVRIVAAMAVLFSHCFALAVNSQDAEPFRRLFGQTAGTMAVDLFFITSGFLVTGSLLARSTLIEFVWARVLRIYPALIVMLLLTVFGLGLFFTTSSVSSYLGDLQTYAYLLKNAVLFTGVTYELPGVFDGNHYSNGVNGSLWTMPIEITMYTMLAAVWALSGATERFNSGAFRLTILACAAGAGIWHFTAYFYSGSESSWARLSFMFFTGAAFFILKERFDLSRTLFWLAVVALALSATDKRVFFVVYDLVMAYVLLYLAFVPAGKVRGFNRVGDYSYGVYIYAFPVQQSVAALAPGISVASMFLLSAAITLGLAAGSWHMLEKHALGLKRTCVESTRRLLVRLRRARNYLRPE